MFIIHQGPDPYVGDEPMKIFGSEITDDERRELIFKAYDQLKESFEKFRKPDGHKESPAKTCRDLAVAHPDLKSGKFTRRFLFQCKLYFNVVSCGHKTF